MKTLEIQIRSLSLTEPFENSGQLSLISQLIWPRPAIVGRAGIKQLTLSKGKARLPLKPVYPRILLKEKVDGRFGLNVGITRIQRNPKAAEFLQNLLVTTLEATGGILSSTLQLPATALKQVIEAPFDQLADQLDDDSLKLVAQAGFDFDSESALDGEHTFELKLTETLRIGPEIKKGAPKERQVRNRKSQTFKKGTVVGAAVIKLSTD